METSAKLESTGLYGSLDILKRSPRSNNKIVGAFLGKVDGEERIRWIQEEANRREITESRLCRLLLNDAVKREMSLK